MYCDYRPPADKGRHSYRSRRVGGSTQAYRLILRPNRSDFSAVEQVAHRHQNLLRRAFKDAGFNIGVFRAQQEQQQAGLAPTATQPCFQNSQVQLQLSSPAQIATPQSHTSFDQFRN